MYGYVDEQQQQNESSTTIDYDKAILEVQNFHGLQKTGKLNNETINLMNKSRCHHPDKVQRY